MSESQVQFRPSGADGWMNCALWQNDPSESEYAAEGTMLHEVVAKALGDGGALPEGLDAEQQEAVEFCLDAVDSIEYAERWVETQLNISTVTSEPGATGTPDLVLYNSADKWLTVVDFKFGRMPVAATYNKQLMIYAQAWLNANPDYEVQRIWLVIVQPRLNFVDHAQVTMAELMDIEYRAKDAVAAYGLEEATPGEKQCKWCKRAGRCEAQNKFVMATVADDFVDMSDGDALARKMHNAIELVDQVDVATLARMTRASDLIEQWVGKVRQRSFDLLSSGQPVPGYKLVSGRPGNRKWKDPVEAAYGLSALGVDHNDIYKREVLSPAQAEKLLAKDKRDELEKMVVRSEPKPVLAAEHDKRPAIDVLNQFSLGDK